MATVEMVEKMMQGLQDKQEEQLIQITTSFQDTMKEMAKEFNKNKGFHDDKLNKPSQFKGDEKKYHEWMVKFLAYLRSKNPGCDEWLKWAMDETVPVNFEKIMNK